MRPASEAWWRLLTSQHWLVFSIASRAWFFDCLDRVKPCPGENCKKRIYLAALLVHLNDDHRLTREQIAEWLTQESND